MIAAAVVAILIAGIAYVAGLQLAVCVIIAVVLCLMFAFNLSRAEVEELKLILNVEAPGWQERNARWTSTWDWNRASKRQQRREPWRVKQRREFWFKAAYWSAAATIVALMIWTLGVK